MAKKDPNKSIKDEKNKRNNKGGGKMRTADFRDANKNGVDDRDEGKKPKRSPNNTKPKRNAGDAMKAQPVAGETPKQTNDRVDALSKPAPEPRDYRMDKFDERRQKTKSKLYDLSQIKEEDRQTIHGYQERGGQHRLKQIDKQEAARQGMMDSQYDFKDLSKYDSKSAGGGGFDMRDIKYLQKQGVSDDEIKNYINSRENVSEGIRYNEQWGGDKYVGSIDSANANISDFDVGKGYNISDINYLRNQGYTDQQIADDMIARNDKGFGAASANFLNKQGRLDEWEAAKAKRMAGDAVANNPAVAGAISNSNNQTNVNSNNTTTNIDNSRTDNSVNDSNNTSNNNSFNTDDNSNNSTNNSNNTTDSFNSTDNSQVDNSTNDSNNTTDSFNTNVGDTNVTGATINAGATIEANSTSTTNDSFNTNIGDTNTTTTVDAGSSINDNSTSTTTVGDSTATTTIGDTDINANSTIDASGDVSTDASTTATNTTTLNTDNSSTDNSTDASINDSYNTDYFNSNNTDKSITDSYNTTEDNRNQGIADSRIDGSGAQAVGGDAMGGGNTQANDYSRDNTTTTGDINGSVYGNVGGDYSVNFNLAEMMQQYGNAGKKFNVGKSMFDNFANAQMTIGQNDNAAEKRKGQFAGIFMNGLQNSGLMKS